MTEQRSKRSIREPQEYGEIIEIDSKEIRKADPEKHVKSSKRLPKKPKPPQK
jgi:hypothetical protein